MNKQNNSFKKYKNFYLKDRILSLRVQKSHFYSLPFGQAEASIY